MFTHGLRVRTLCFGIVSAFLTGYITLAQDNAAFKEIEEIHAKRTKAVRDKDFAYLKKHQADDYTEKAEDGTVLNRQQADAQTDELFATLKEVHEYSSKIDRITDGKVKGEVVVEISEAGKFGFLGPDGKLHELLARGRSRDVWVLTRQGWRIKYHEELESHIEVDGNKIK